MVLFHTFHSQEERRTFGGSAFIEMQFCKLPSETRIEEIVAVRSINHWQNDSLYIDDENLFYREYSHLFQGGIYNNLQSGVVDLYGVNYYPPEAVQAIIDGLRADSPVDADALLAWLSRANAYNGIYVLGI